MHDFLNDKRFEGIKPLNNRVHLSSPTPHKKEEMLYIEECYKTGWLTTIGKNIDELENIISEYMNGGKNIDAKKRAVALANGTSAIHLAIKLAAEKVYHSSTGITTPAAVSSEAMRHFYR